MNNSILQCHPHLQTIQFSCPVDLIDSTFLLVNCLQPTKIHSFYNYSLWVMKRLHALNSKLVIACNYLEVSNSDVWGMQCFCSVVSRIFRKQHCKNTESPKNLNYQPLLAIITAICQQFYQICRFIWTPFTCMKLSFWSAIFHFFSALVIKLEQNFWKKFV